MSGLDEFLAVFDRACASGSKGQSHKAVDLCKKARALALPIYGEQSVVQAHILLEEMEFWMTAGEQAPNRASALECSMAAWYSMTRALAIVRLRQLAHPLLAEPGTLTDAETAFFTHESLRSAKDLQPEMYDKRASPEIARFFAISAAVRAHTSLVRCSYAALLRLLIGKMCSVPFPPLVGPEARRSASRLVADGLDVIARLPRHLCSVANAPEMRLVSGMERAFRMGYFNNDRDGGETAITKFIEVTPQARTTPRQHPRTPRGPASTHVCMHARCGPSPQ